MNRSLIPVVCMSVLACCSHVCGAPWGTVIFHDYFTGPDGAPPDPNRWVLNHPGEFWWVQGRAHFPEPSMSPPSTPEHWLPYLKQGACVIENHLYNPFDLATVNTTFLGGEIHTYLEFDANRDYRFEARVRCYSYPNGLVTSFFTYGDHGSKSDEIDFEFLSNKTNDDANYPDGDPVLTNTWNESKQKPRWAVDGNLIEWNTFRIYWYPALHRVQWHWLDPNLDPLDPNAEKILRTETDADFIPNEPMSLYFNFWEPNTDWPDGYDGTLQPVSDPNFDVTYSYEIDYVEVRVPEPLSCTALSAGAAWLLARGRCSSRRREPSSHAR